ncbi:MAG: SCO1664 family protein [Chloroflexi bacterium]|nr:SCO1664 family protein [Chloroflexota bacterium]
MALHQAYPSTQIAEGRHEVGPADVDAEAFVRTAAIGDGWLHPRSSNYTFVVELTCDGRNGYGVYKPERGEAPLWDFPSGTLYRRECAMYELARALDWGLVPPTVARDGEVGIGSLQLFVPSPDSVNFFTMRDSHSDELFRMAVLDVIANNADRKGGHCLADGNGRLWGVDHGLTFHTERKLRTVIWDFAGLDVPEDLLAGVRKLLEAVCTDDSDEINRLSEFLSAREMDALRARLQGLVESPSMPQPYSRRDVPWPWI